MQTQFVTDILGWDDLLADNTRLSIIGKKIECRSSGGHYCGIIDRWGLTRKLVGFRLQSLKVWTGQDKGWVALDRLPCNVRFLRRKIGFIGKLWNGDIELSSDELEGDSVIIRMSES